MTTSDAGKNFRAKPAEIPSPARAWYSPAALWQRKTTLIAALSLVGIAAHLALRFGFHATTDVSRIPLLVTLVIGGLPMLYDLLRKLLKREFGSDLLGGISIITSVALGEYLAGSIIVLMLAGGEALESYALRSASSVLAALAKRMPSIAHRKRESEILDVALSDVAVGDTLVIYLGRFRWAAWLVGIVLIEVLMLVINGLRCPLTDVAARYTTDRRDNFGLYLPLWLARHNQTNFGILFVLGSLFTLARWRFRCGG